METIKQIKCIPSRVSSKRRLRQGTLPGQAGRNIYTLPVRLTPEQEADLEKVLAYLPESFLNRTLYASRPLSPKQRRK